MSVVAVNERLAALTAAGTSVWLDQLRRDMIESGELQRLVAEESLRGVRSDPAIFEKAILGSPDDEHGEDVEVPGEPYSFARLIDAQADGDLDTHRAHDLTVARVRLPADDLAGAIDDLTARLR
jgi:hypothetical protein